MGRSGILYQVGHEGVLEHAFLFHFENAGFFGAHAAGITRFVEFWCQRNCRGRWQVVEMTQTMRVAFDQGRDVVLFQLSEEYTRFAGTAHGIVQRPRRLS